MKLIIENGGSKLDWALLESDIINTSKSINLFDLDDVIVNQINQIFPSRIFFPSTINQICINQICFI